MSADPKRLRELFLAVAEMPAADRASYLTENCGGDAALRVAVDHLLAAYEQPEGDRNSPAPVIQTVDFPSIRERPGTKIGPYKLMEQIGEGGFGLVFVAEQTQPVKRRVALKIIKPDMDSKQVIARFEAERQALVLMHHPNIARVLDADAVWIPSDRQTKYNAKRANPESKAHPDVWRIRRVFSTPHERIKGHSCQMPLALIERIIRTCTNPGELVLDPMCGTGSACVAVAGLGRRFVGIELSEATAAKARER